MTISKQPTINMTKTNWDQKYSEHESVYGTDPNTFLAEHVGLLQDPILSIGEGEGRNAVFLASKGFNVHGVDGSSVGLTKAQALAHSRGVNITTEVADLMVFEPTENTYGSVVSIFAHVPSEIRLRLAPQLHRCLKPGGTIILESYSEDQLGRGTGGPPTMDMLMTTTKIEQSFPGFEPILLQQIEREVIEGSFHTGLASVVQFIGRKRT